MSEAIAKALDGVRQELANISQELSAIRLALEVKSIHTSPQDEPVQEVDLDEWTAAYRSLRATLDHDWNMTKEQGDQVHAEIKAAHSLASLKELAPDRVAAIASAYREAAQLRKVIDDCGQDGAELIKALLSLKNRTLVWEITAADWRKGLDLARSRPDQGRAAWAQSMIAKGNAHLAA